MMIQWRSLDDFFFPLIICIKGHSCLGIFMYEHAIYIHVMVNVKSWVSRRQIMQQTMKAFP